MNYKNKQQEEEKKGTQKKTKQTTSKHLTIKVLSQTGDEKRRNPYKGLF